MHEILILLSYKAEHVHLTIITIAVSYIMIHGKISTCIAAYINITLEFATYNTAEGDGSVEVCAVLDGGVIEAGETFVTQLETSPGSANAGKFRIDCAY